MSLLFEQKLVSEREQEAKKLFGFVVSKNPDELYERMEKPVLAELPRTARTTLSAEYAVTKGYESKAQDLLLFGLADTQEFLLGIMQHHPDIPFERAVEIASHERTVKALAMIARQNSQRSTALLRSPHDVYDLAPDKAAIDIDDSIMPATVEGCPAVEVAGDSVEPWPIFNRFVPWASRLALLSYYDHKNDHTND
jgi:hypothetical protein